MQDRDKITYFAQTNSRGKAVPFGIKRRDRERHMYIIGKTGMGKSTLLENMAIQDVRNGEGVAFIDPHGSTADRILEYVPEHRIKDVLYFAPFDMENPVAFNVMEDVGYDKRHLVVSGLISAFKKIWGPDSWSARMEYILSNTLLALLEYPGSTLLDVNRMLVNKNFRKKVVDNISDPIVKAFWAEEFANYTDRYTQEATPAIQNKIGQFTSNPLIRNIVGQPKSSFDLRQMMDDKKIIIMNLSKGRVGEVNANLLGSMLVTKIYLAAMSRADVHAKTLAELPSFYFYVDEFQNFANESFSDILSEARKYKLNLIIAHQYIEQMEEEVRNAVFGNVGTTVAFRVGPFDAEVLETIFQPQFTQADLVNLGFAQVYLTLMIDGVGSPPFSATTLSPFDLPPERFVEQVIKSSQQQFSKRRTDVEQFLKDWSEPDSMVQKKTVPAVSSASTTPIPVKPAQSNSLRPAQQPSDSAGASQPGSASASPKPVIALQHAGSPRPQQSRPRPAEAGSRGSAQVQSTHASRASVQTPSSHTPRSSTQTPQKPQLEGAMSLKEALMQATSKKESTSVEKETEPKQEDRQERQEKERKRDTPSQSTLKEALGKIAGEDKPRQPGLPEETLRNMLRVDESGHANR
ncbi:MAG TPA: type IV secretion system DNA-binding domain-containing protein [Candidatus Paceibacterota bacterium]|nr:type IV secretion system DNA-binding domain-containing protein [Candidatus Paceibacterota bacterium]